MLHFIRNESLRLAHFLDSRLLRSYRARSIIVESSICWSGRRHVSLPGQRGRQRQSIGLGMFCKSAKANLSGEQRSHDRYRRRRDGKNRELQFSLRCFAIRDDLHGSCPYGSRAQSRPCARLPGHPDPDAVQHPVLLLSMQWVSVELSTTTPSLTVAHHCPAQEPSTIHGLVAAQWKTTVHSDRRSATATTSAALVYDAGPIEFD